MPRPLSLDLRQRIVFAVQDGESHLAVARRFGVCNKTVANYLKLKAAGSLEPKKCARRPWRKFTDAALDALKAWLEEKNDLTLKQMQQWLAGKFQIHVSQPAIWERLTAMNLVWKKNDPCRRTGASGRSGATGKLAGRDRRHSREQTGVCR